VCSKSARAAHTLFVMNYSVLSCNDRSVTMLHDSIKAATISTVDVVKPMYLE
jgi:hypothetical protein